jgi:membrane protein DedA with SNARE-associated domain
METLAFLYMYRYPALFVGAFFEGPIIMAATGFLVKLGYFNVILAYILLILGDLAGDVAWYYLGYFGANNFISKFGRFFGITEKIFERVKSIFSRHHAKIIFFSKITMGFGLAVAILTTAGISKVPIKKFIILNLLGGFIWTAFVMTLGYFFGSVYLLISESLRIGFIIGVGLLVSFALYGFSRFLRQEVLKNKIL